MVRGPTRPFLLSQAETPLTPEQETVLARMDAERERRGAYHKRRDTPRARIVPEEVAPQLVRGETAPPEFVVRENGLRFALRFSEGYSVGLFLDQRDNRRRLLTGHVAAGLSRISRRGRGR